MVLAASSDANGTCVSGGTGESGRPGVSQRSKDWVRLRGVLSARNSSSDVSENALLLSAPPEPSGSPQITQSRTSSHPLPDCPCMQDGRWTGTVWHRTWSSRPPPPELSHTEAKVTHILQAKLGTKHQLSKDSWKVYRTRHRRRRRTPNPGCPDEDLVVDFILLFCQCEPVRRKTMTGTPA